MEDQGEQLTDVKRNINTYRFFERDVSWLAFNCRVLQEAADPSVPLFERLKFLAIFSNNLDEFFRVRISALKRFRKLKKGTRKLFDDDPKRVLNRIRIIVEDQQVEFGRIYSQEIVPELRKYGIHLVLRSDLNKTDLEFVNSFYNSHLKDALEIKYVNVTDETCFLENNALYFAVQLEGTLERFAIVNIPVKACGRFVELDAPEGEMRITFLDEIVKSVLQKKIPGYQASYSIKLSRDAELYIGDEFDGDLIEKIKTSLEDRNIGTPTRFLFDQNIPHDFLNVLRAHFHIRKKDTLPGARHHNFNDFFSFPHPESLLHLAYPEMPPLNHKHIDEAHSMIEMIRKRDLILHFPYQKYDYIVRLIKEASESGEVDHIKMTLYRAASNSIVLKTLIEALERGKQVTVFIEAKARFDEESNIRWGDRLKAAGATVLYSYPGIKVHTKLLLIEFKENVATRSLAYIGTGNFNENTARIYCDHALFTVHPSIMRDVSQIFQVLERKILITNPKRLLVSPYTLRSEFHQLIDHEIDLAREGRKAYMFLKMNSLEDKRIIRKLYEASNAGVRIRIIVRGICCLIPGVEGMSENIEIISIIDRFLEHSRVYIFGNGGNEVMYIASADWMTRNLDRRVEAAVPILNRTIYGELRDIMDIQWSDRTKARRIDSLLSNEYVDSSDEPGRPRAQYDIYQYLKDKYT